MKNIPKMLWCAFLTIPLVANLWNHQRMAENFEVFSNITFLIVLQNFLVALCIIAICIGLMELSSILKWSWFSLFNTRNELTGEIIEHQGENINVTPMKVKYLGPVFAILLALNLPQFAHIEEVWFREGTRSWQHGLILSFIFGMLHCLVGVPLAAGLALSVAGLWFTHQYFIGGVELSTVHHTTYNLILISVGFAFIILSHVEEWGKRRQTAS